VVSLAFLLHRQWEPYEKWRGAMLARLPSAADLAGPLEAACGPAGWRDREAGLAAAIKVLARVQRETGLPTPDTVVTPFFDRPYRTVPESLAGLLLGEITHPVLTRLRVRAGSVAQWADSVDVMAHPQRRAALAAAYRAWLDE
jgi:hypothetical protein